MNITTTTTSITTTTVITTFIFTNFFIIIVAFACLSGAMRTTVNTARTTTSWRV